MKKRFLALLLVGCLLIVLGACQTEQDELYSQAVEDQKSAASVQPTADPNDPDYLGDPTPLPGTAFTPVPQDDLQGELVIKSYMQMTNYSDRLDLLIEEFTRLHPGVEIHVDYHLSASQPVLIQQGRVEDGEGTVSRQYPGRVGQRRGGLSSLRSFRYFGYVLFKPEWHPF